MCRLCQFLTTCRLCCSRISQACEVGRLIYEADKKEFDRTRRHRVNLISAVHDKTFPLPMSWLGTNPELKYTTLGRIAFALGPRAAQLEMVLTKLVSSAKKLELEHPNLIIRKWRREGEKAGNAYACPTTTYKITLVFLKAESLYTKWLTKTEAEDRPLTQAPPGLIAT